MNRLAYRNHSCYRNQVIHDTIKILAIDQYCCIATLTELEKRSGFARTSVCRSLKDLIEQGVITKRSCIDRYGRSIANVYHITQ